MRDLIIILSVMILCGCTKDIGYLPYCDKNPSTYNAVVKPIIDQKCSGPYCHHSGAFMGDITNYTGLKEKIDKGTFKTLVFDNKVMPPSNSVQLTDDEFNLIKCWLDDGAPEN